MESIQNSLYMLHRLSIQNYAFQRAFWLFFSLIIFQDFILIFGNSTGRLFIGVKETAIFVILLDYCSIILGLCNLII